MTPTNKVAWLSFIVTGTALCIVWWAYLIPIKSTFPHADDVNFFIPLWMEIERTGLWPTIFIPQGPHFHFQYKMISGLQLYLGSYDTRVYTVLGPLALLLSAGMLVKWWLEATGRISKIQQMIGGAMIAFLILGPYRYVDLTYDMVAFGGSLFLAVQIYLLVKVDGFLRTGRGFTILLIMAFLASVGIGISSFKTFFASTFIALLLINLFQIKRVSSLFGGGPSRRQSQPYLLKRSLMIAGVLLAFWLTYDALLAFHPSSNGASSELSLVNFLSVFRDAIGISFGGDKTFDQLGLASFETTIVSVLGLLIFFVCLWLVPRLSIEQHVLPTVLMGSAAFAALGGYVLRGTSEIPRYAGSYSLLWVGLALGVLVCLTGRQSETFESNSPDYPSPGGLFAVFPYIFRTFVALIGLIFVVATSGYVSERLEARPFVNKFYEMIDATYAIDVNIISDAEMRRVCRRPRPQCDAVILRIQSLRANRVPNSALTP